MLEWVFAISQADDVTDDRFKKLQVHSLNQEGTWDIAAISAFYYGVTKSQTQLSD